ncbi:MAG: hypothetical protein M3N52_01740 [Actinomycetota bacterium]|nr:hypothetical protein [Actinomycetota bacterium]
MRFAVAQAAPVAGDLAGNLQQAQDLVGAADGAGADLVVFPELHVSGYIDERQGAYMRNLKESRGPVDRSFLAHGVLYLARSAKSREVDDLLNVAEVLQGELGWAAVIPDEALDLHVPEGRERVEHRDRFSHWIEEASQVSPRQGPYDWRLWMLRWAARRGHYAVEFVDRLAERWAAQGRLRFGVEGYGEARIFWRDVEREFIEVEPRWGDQEDGRWQ